MRRHEKTQKCYNSWIIGANLFFEGRARNIFGIFIQ